MALIQRVLRSLDERSEATNLGLVSFDSGRVDLPLEREVLLMESDLLRPWLVAVVELARDEWAGVGAQPLQLAVRTPSKRAYHGLPRPIWAPRPFPTTPAYWPVPRTTFQVPM